MWRIDQAPEPDPVIEACKRDVDRTLIRENLRRSVEERIEALMRAQKDLEAIAELEALLEERRRVEGG